MFKGVRACCTLDAPGADVAPPRDPVLQIAVRGETTAISNFGDVCTQLRRQPEHVARFFMQELVGAVPATSWLSFLNVSTCRAPPRCATQQRSWSWARSSRSPSCRACLRTTLELKCAVCSATACIRPWKRAAFAAMPATASPVPPPRRCVARVLSL